jgi:sulfite reductase alpha subunit-like flavoprotein
MSRQLAAAAASPSPLSPALILYGTVTGQAETIAQQVADEWRKEFSGVPIEVMSTEQLMQKEDNVSREHTQHTTRRAMQRAFDRHGGDQRTTARSAIMHSEERSNTDDIHAQ